MHERLTGGAAGVRRSMTAQSVQRRDDSDKQKKKKKTRHTKKSPDLWSVVKKDFQSDAFRDAEKVTKLPTRDIPTYINK